MHHIRRCATPEQFSSHIRVGSAHVPGSAVHTGTTEELAHRLLALSPPGGADVVAVRCGPEGVLVARRALPEYPRGAVAAAEADVESYRVGARKITNPRDRMRLRVSTQTSPRHACHRQGGARVLMLMAAFSQNGLWSLSNQPSVLRRGGS